MSLPSAGVFTRTPNETRAGGGGRSVGFAPFYKCYNEHARPLGGNVTICHIPVKDSLSMNRDFFLVGIKRQLIRKKGIFTDDTEPL